MDERGRKHYWKLPVTQAGQTEAKRGTREAEATSSGLTAAQAQASDWISRVREIEATLLKAYGQIQYLVQYGEALGYVIVTPDSITTTLTDAEFVGENSGMNIAEFCQAWAGLVKNVLPSVPDELAALLMRNARGAL